MVRAGSPDAPGSGPLHKVPGQLQSDMLRNRCYINIRRTIDTVLLHLSHLHDEIVRAGQRLHDQRACASNRTEVKRCGVAQPGRNE